MQKADTSFESKWPAVHGTLQKLLYQQNVSKAEWHDLFAAVHNISVWDESGPQKLITALDEVITGYVKDAERRVMQHQEDSALLKAYIVEWKKFFTLCEYLPKPFSQVESTLGVKMHTGPSKKSAKESRYVTKIMLKAWNQNIFMDIKHRLQASAMKLVEQERRGEPIDAGLVIGVRESYVNLSPSSDERLRIYEDNFERSYLDSTETFYRTQANQHLNMRGVQEYMEYADKKLKEEEDRAKRYLETKPGCNSVSKLVARCVDVLVSAFKEAILQECEPMINEGQTERLRLMFSLLDRVPDGVQPMREALERHIRQKGLENMVASAQLILSDSEQYVEKLLDLFEQFSSLVDRAFSNDPRFLTSRDIAYEAIVNDTSVFRLELPTKKAAGGKTLPESRCPEQLANYCDMLLRKTPLSKRLTSDEVEKRLKDVLLVLKYVQNKDVFMKYHKAHLTRRLILDSSADTEKEEAMVDWLREGGMPAEYVNKLARMFQDVKVSGDLNQEFKEQLRNNSQEAMAETVGIKILNMGSWLRPSERIAVTLPRELEDFVPRVEDFYKQKHLGRRLHWNHLMSNGTLTFDSDVGKYDIDVTTFQMAVLYAWNSRRHDRISFESLRLATELPDGELRRTLWSLVAYPKLAHQLLCYSPEVSSARDFNPATVFWLNNGFCLVKNKKVQKRGKLNLIGRLQLQTEKVREEENEEIVHLRVLRVQEAIVTIMKSRKRMHNAELCSELIRLLARQFVPSRKMIKEQIDWMIQNDYLRRDEVDMSVYIYRA
ncbi:hypothetical protein BOX15_Mlig003586g1 [Macrostomum lignano]|uniref:Cullin-5 n=1 Tax=Macrostomum lignano TaxID=282301 RepID=A0A267EN74_9PLAT|nr:hypothetical protein BOX15_Mlig003586g1 [Macrostomum lignano]